MSTMDRREWARLVMGGIAGGGALIARPAHAWQAPEGQRIEPRIEGVPIGVQSYSFRALTLDESLKAMQALSIGMCELWQGHVEPRNLTAQDKRSELRAWRLETPLETFAEIRTRFEKVGVDLFAYNISFRSDFTDAEIERGFLMAQTLGASLITASAQLSVVPRLLDFATEYRIPVAFHNHSRIADDEFATPQDFATALASDPTGSALAINLDLGHFTAAGFDGLEFLREHHRRILAIHLKDRKRDDGPNVPWGEGDTPIREVLQELRDRKWRIPTMIEYEYDGDDPIVEVRRCLDYCRAALEAS